MYIGFEHTKAVLNEGIYAFAQERHKPDPMRKMNLDPPPLGEEAEPSQVLMRLSPIIPKVNSVILVFVFFKLYNIQK